MPRMISQSAPIRVVGAFKLKKEKKMSHERNECARVPLEEYYWTNIVQSRSAPVNLYAFDLLIVQCLLATVCNGLFIDSYWFLFYGWRNRLHMARSYTDHNWYENIWNAWICCDDAFSLRDVWINETQMLRSWHCLAVWCLVNMRTVYTCIHSGWR